MFCISKNQVCFVANPSMPSLSNAYGLATHTVKVRRTGALYDVMALWDLSGMCFKFKLVILFVHCALHVSQAATLY